MARKNPTRYVVAATPTHPEPKVMANPKSAKREAEARAKTDRTEVIVTTEATGKTYYTANHTPLNITVVPPLAMVQEAHRELEEQAKTDPEIAEFVEFAKKFRQEQYGEEAPAAEEAEGAPEPKVASCGCLVDEIIVSGEHGKGCADAPAEKAPETPVAKARKSSPATRADAGQRGGRRVGLGASAVDGWELLYDKPRQDAQVGRSTTGGHALICTIHKTAHPLTKLVQERKLRQGPRNTWCPNC